MQALILFSCLVAAASAWNCPQLPVVQNLNVTELAGTWYQQGSAGAASLSGTCIKDVFTVDTTGNSLFTFENSKTGLLRTVTVSGTVNWADPDNQNGKLTVTIPTVFFDVDTDVWVLDTDYDNYLVLYSCRKVLNVPAEASWLFRRIQNPTKEEKAELDALIENAFVDIESNGGPDLTDYVPTCQEKCKQ